MSRIYEALQKAEAERGSERLPVHAEPTSTHYSTAAALSAVAEMEAPPVASPTQSQADGGLRLNQTSFASESLPESATIATRPWSPVLAQLPSLMERGPGVEQFRSLRSRVYELRDVKPLRSILISSALPQEGKSFVAVNLAISLARNRNSRVLLIDGDMRRSTVHRVLGCTGEPGLAEYLLGTAGLYDVMQRPDNPRIADVPGIRAAGMPALTLIPGGQAGDRAADLSNNPRFPELIGMASSLFDWIIVDSSPVIPVSDGVNLARSCDGVLLVTRGGVTDFKDAQRAQNELKASNVLGVVLNAVAHSKKTPGYYGYDPKPE